jgi:hypothetical protein
MLLNHFWNRSQHWQFEIFDWTEFVPLSKVQITTAHTVLIKKSRHPTLKKFYILSSKFKNISTCSID